MAALFPAAEDEDAEAGSAAWWGATAASSSSSPSRQRTRSSQQRWVANRSATTSATVEAQRVHRAERELAECTFSPNLERSQATFAERRVPGRSPARKLSLDEREHLHPKGRAKSIWCGGVRVSSPTRAMEHAASRGNVASPSRSARLSLYPRAAGEPPGDAEYDAEFLSGLLDTYHERKAGPVSGSPEARGSPARPRSPFSPARSKGGGGPGREALSALAGSLLAAEAEIGRLQEENRGLLDEKRGLLRRVEAENAVLASALGGVRSAAAAAAAATVGSLDARLDALPLADPVGADDGGGMAELHASVCEVVRDVADQQRRTLDAALAAAAEAEAAALAGDGAGKLDALVTLQNLFDQLDGAEVPIDAAAPPAEDDGDDSDGDDVAPVYERKLTATDLD